MLPFCRLIAQVLPKEKTTIVNFVVAVCRRAQSGVCVFFLLLSCSAELVFFW